MIAIKPALFSVALLLGAGLALVGEPTHEDRLAELAAAQDATLASRKLHLDPAEVNGLVHNKQVKVQLLDVRDEGAYNLFHLIDSQHVDPASFRHPQIAKRLDPKSLKILIANDEAKAEAAWRDLNAEHIRDVYILAGGVNLWLQVFEQGQRQAQPKLAQSTGELRHSFTAALGARHPAAYPDEALTEGRDFKKKAKMLTKVVKLAGGCGS